MKTKKKLLSTILACTLVFSLSACGGTKNETAQSDPTPAADTVDAADAASSEQSSLTVSSLFSSNETIWFKVAGSVAKDSTVIEAFVFEPDGTYITTQQLQSGDFPTLGELSQMSDEEIITLIKNYREDFSKYSFDLMNIADDATTASIKDYFLNGSHKYQFCYLTDSTGNNIQEEYIAFESNMPHVLYYTSKEYNSGRHQGAPEAVAGDDTLHLEYGPVTDAFYIGGTQGYEIYASYYIGLTEKDSENVLITRSEPGTSLELDSDLSNGFPIDKNMDIFDEQILFEADLKVE